MSAGSNASNLGYGNQSPLSNVNGSYINVDSSSWPGRFGSNEIPGLPGLAGAKSNVDAAAGVVPGICMFKGGAKSLKRKIKSINRRYKKMKKGSRKVKTLKRRMASSSFYVSAAGSRGRRNKKVSKRSRRVRRRSSSQRGGYSQYQNNAPITPVYSVGGINGATLPTLALANPPPIHQLSNCVNCTDNYNHYTNKGFPSPGH